MAKLPIKTTSKPATPATSSKTTPKQAIKRKAKLLSGAVVLPKPLAAASSRITKLSTLINLLRSREGVTIAEVSRQLGWQAHSVRGALSGTVGKKLGHVVTNESVEGRGRVYRIAG
jgi:uncharacterized protein (DUF2141 family)